MKKLLVTVFSIMAMLPAMGKVVKDVDIVHGGKLRSVLTQDELNNTDSIHILCSSGRINADDMSVLRWMCEKGKLTGIDLSQVQIAQDAIPERAFMSSSINGAQGQRSAAEPSTVNLRYIRLPKNVRRIGDMAFYQTNLVAIDIPKTVDYIGTEAFGHCRELRRMTVHKPSPTSLTADDAFDNFLQNAVLAIPEGSATAFSSASGWKFFGNVVEQPGLYSTLHVSLAGKPLDEISGDALLQTDSLVVTGQLAASDFKALRNAVNNGRLTGINLGGCTMEGNVLPESAFSYYAYGPERKNCSNLLYVSLPDGLTAIGEDAFLSSLNLRCINIPKTVRTIGKRAFTDCIRLGGAVTIPEGVTVIPDSTFYDCKLVTEINLPSTLENLGDLSLCLIWETYDPWPLTAVRVNRMTPPVLLPADHMAFSSDDGLYNVRFKNCTLYVPVGAKQAYESAEEWKEFPNIVETPELDGGTSAIGGVKTADAATDKEQRIYTLDGRYVGKDMDGLGKGVYVVGGRKVVR